MALDWVSAHPRRNSGLTQLCDQAVLVKDREVMITNRRLGLVLLVVVVVFVMAMVGVGLSAESDFWLIALPAYVTGAGTLPAATELSHRFLCLVRHFW